MPIARESEQEASILDDFADAMGHEYRRRILFSLHCQDDGPLLIPGDLRNNEQDLDRFHTTLVHTHLPKLHSTGYIEWDRTTDTVRPGANFEHLDPLLEVLEIYYDYIVPIADSGQKA